MKEKGMEGDWKWYTVYSDLIVWKDHVFLLFDNPPSIMTADGFFLFSPSFCAFVWSLRLSHRIARTIDYVKL